LAKCQINQGNYPDAVSWLHLASQVPVVTPDVSGNITNVIMVHDLLQWLIDCIYTMLFICCCLKYNYMYVWWVFIKLTGFIFLLFVLKSVVVFKTKPACLSIIFCILTIRKGMWMQSQLVIRDMDKPAWHYIARHDDFLCLCSADGTHTERHTAWSLVKTQTAS
jgi:hypothetical protein